MLNVGLTGNIGSGKSSVAQLLAELGAEVIDADRLAREATADGAVLDRIRNEFGDDVIRNGELDRAALADIVFSSEQERLRLNAIIHPWVRREAQRLLGLHRQRGVKLVVQDIPLLYESGLQDGFDRVIVVTAPLEQRVERVAARSGLEPTEVKRRDAAQWPLERKEQLADFVIDNSGTPAELADQVKRIWRELNLELPPEQRHSN